MLCRSEFLHIYFCVFVCANVRVSVSVFLEKNKIKFIRKCKCERDPFMNECVCLCCECWTTQTIEFYPVATIDITIIWEPCKMEIYHQNRTPCWRLPFLFCLLFLFFPSPDQIFAYFSGFDFVKKQLKRLNFFHFAIWRNTLKNIQWSQIFPVQVSRTIAEFNWTHFFLSFDWYLISFLSFQRLSFV